MFVALIVVVVALIVVVVVLLVVVAPLVIGLAVDFVSIIFIRLFRRRLRNPVRKTM